MGKTVEEIASDVDDAIYAHLCKHLPGFTSIWNARTPQGVSEGCGDFIETAIAAALQAERSRAEQAVREARAKALEEAAALRDTFVTANYGTDWDRGLKQGMDEYQAAIRALAKPALSQPSPDDAGG